MTLDPTASLAASTLYTATIKGVAPAGPRTWRGTRWRPTGCGRSRRRRRGASTYLSDLTWTSMTNGWGPVERDRSNGDSGAADGGPLSPQWRDLRQGARRARALGRALRPRGGCSLFTALVGVDDEAGRPAAWCSRCGWTGCSATTAA